MWIDFSAALARDPQTVGLKAAGVARLAQAGLSVPRSWCLPVGAEPAASACLAGGAEPAASGLEELRAAVASGDGHAWRRPLALLRARVASLPPSAEMRAAVESLCAVERAPLAVRSSAIGEGASLSGLLSSFLGVQGPEALLGAIQGCWLSRWSDHVVRYALGRALDLEQLRMGVLVQPMVDARASGGARSQAGQVTIEATWGLGRALAEGEVVPDLWRVEQGQVQEARPGDKRLRVDLGPGGGGERWRRVADDEARRACLEDAAVLRVAELAQAAEQSFAGPVELEWAQAHDGHVWLLQARRATARPHAAFASSRDDSCSGHGADGSGRANDCGADGWLEGLPAASGQAFGRARVMHSADELHGLGPEDVLVARGLRPGSLAGVAALAGLVLEAGGTTSHAATLARERGIPAVLGVRDATRIIPDGDEVLVDGDAGRVLLAKKTSPAKKTPR